MNVSVPGPDLARPAKPPDSHRGHERNRMPESQEGGEVCVQALYRGPIVFAGAGKHDPDREGRGRKSFFFEPDNRTGC
ncbi:MAG: hypothetical protein OXC82_05290 [Rhodobacteraceae bacterium]|nr:hypothetical protein [Paracoccaceae bacterium]